MFNRVIKLLRNEVAVKTVERNCGPQKISLNEISSVATAENESLLPFDAIPTARRLPLLGNKLDLMISGSPQKLHEFVGKRHCQLGPIFREPMGPIEVVFVSSPDLMRNVFMYEGKCPRHPIPEAWLLYNQEHGCKRGLFFMDGEEWLENRKLMNTLLMRNEIPHLKEIIENTTDTFITSLQKMSPDINSKAPYELKNLERHLYQWSINTIIFLMLGQNVDHQKKLLEPLVNIFADRVHTIFESSSKFGVMPANLAKYWNTRVWTEFEKNVTETLELARQIVDLSIDNLDTGDGLLAEMKNLGMSRDIINRLFVDLVIAAGDTTSFSVQWAFYLLSQNTEIQEKVRNEILNDSENLYETPLVRGTLREAMRLFPVAPFIGRFLSSNAVLGQYKLPKDSLVCLSLFTAGRDEHNFTNPMEFSPSRWIRGTDHSYSSQDMVMKPHGTIPYAMGSRSCIGRKIANTSMHVILSKILQNFELKLLNEKEIQPILQMVTVPSEPIRISIKPLNNNIQHKIK